MKNIDLLKNYSKTVITILFVFISNNSFSQKVYVYLNDGTYYHYSVMNVDSIIFIESENIIPEAIDLGLSVRWANFNVGASEPGEYGGLYGWGDISGKKNSMDLNDYPCYYAPFSICGTKHDIARESFGDGWRIPTTEEQKELVENCTFEETEVKLSTGKYVIGHLVTGPNGNSIFLPYVGYRIGTKIYDQGKIGRYWSGSQHYLYYDADNFTSANFMIIGAGRTWYNWGHRYIGMGIRPVKD